MLEKEFLARSVLENTDNSELSSNAYVTSSVISQTLDANGALDSTVKLVRFGSFHRTVYNCLIQFVDAKLGSKVSLQTGRNVVGTAPMHVNNVILEWPILDIAYENMLVNHTISQCRKKEADLRQSYQELKGGH
jgi:hypothetical protein